MSINAILEYPEFLAAGVLTVVLWKSSANQGERFYMPNFLRSAGMFVLHVLPSGYQDWIATQLTWDARRYNGAVGDFAAIKLSLSMAALLTVFFLPIFLSILAAVLLFAVPDLMLTISVRKRQQGICQALPQALDLMVLCVDAGLALDATIQKVSSDGSVLSDALNDELGNLSRDILLGMERGRAYSEMYRRTGVEEIKMLASALNQSNKLGLSISKILRAQADFLRGRQAQKAEERAAKLPVYMAFPLWFCIMPALMFVIIGPALITFIVNSGHGLPAWFR